MEDKDRIITGLQQEVIQLREEVRLLKEQIARLRKDSGNSSKPPSSDIIKPPTGSRRGKVKRKRGGQPGHKKCSRPQFPVEQIDEAFEYELTPQAAVGLTPLDQWHVVQQVTLPAKLYRVTEHRARKYLNPRTGQIVIAPLPAEVQNGGLLGADVTAMTAFLKGGCHMSFSTIQQFFREVMHLEVSRGLLSKTVQKVSGALAPAYQQLAERLPNESHLGIDETGHKDDGKKHWTWCFQNPAYTLFHIDQSRGSQVLFEILGEVYAGIIHCDFWGGYRKFSRLTDALVQYCMAHLIRELKFLAEHSDPKLIAWGTELLKWLKKLFKTLRHAEPLSASRFANKMRRIKKGFLETVRCPPPHTLARNLSRRFVGEAAESYFRFLTDPRVEPTNNGTEREIRHVVIDRRITQGTRGQAGMRWCERVWTIIATCKKQMRNVFDFVHQSLCAHWNGQDYPLLL
jgi:transposase